MINENCKLGEITIYHQVKQLNNKYAFFIALIVLN